MSTPASLPHAAAPSTLPYDRGLPGVSLETSSAWRAELNARLREHRQRRSEATPPDGPPQRAPGSGTAASVPASRVAARVAERYSSAPSYQELLAASAAAAAAAAETAVQAAVEAHAAAQAALSGWEGRCEHVVSPEDAFADPFFARERGADEQQGAEPQASSPAPLGPASFGPDATPPPVAALPGAPTVEHHTPLPARTAMPRRTGAYEGVRALVDAFAEAVVPAAHSLPAKLIEFPRELIAPRKQRPRLAEGPLFEQEPEQESSGMSLRIFEVGTGEQGDDKARATGSIGSGAAAGSGEAASVDDAPAPRASRPGERPDERYGATVKPPRDEYRGEYRGEHEGEAPRRRGGFRSDHDPDHGQAARQQSGWGSIRLGEHPQPEAQAPPAQPAARRPEHGYRIEAEPALHELAPIADRSMAALVDGGIVAACFLLSVLVFASCTVHPPAGKAALAVGLLVLGALATFYGWLFMSYGGGSTPGMRYARIALCSFADENPTRKELQNRVPATALALLPLGLGVFWALLDEDKLGWHDRMTRTYQRSYR